jgi:hypothetical protein
VSERFALLSVLPEKGNYATLRIVGELRNELSFSEDELKKIKFVQEGNVAKWDNGVNLVKYVHIGDVAANLIGDCLREMDNKGTLTLNHISLCDRFMGDN